MGLRLRIYEGRLRAEGGDGLRTPERIGWCLAERGRGAKLLVVEINNDQNESCERQTLLTEVSVGNLGLGLAGGYRVGS